MKSDNLAFGKILREIRKDRGYFIDDVERMTTISSDTLSRSENGQITPKIENLDILSLVYQRDLVELYASHSITYNYTYGRISDIMDEIIKSSNYSDFEKFYKEMHVMLKDEGAHEVIRSNLRQFKGFVRCIEYSIRGDSRFLSELVSSMRISYPGFVLHDMCSHKYSYLEIRLIMVLSIYYRKKRQLKKSDAIHQCIKTQLESDNIRTSEHNFAFTLLYYNMALNRIEENKYEEALESLEKGVGFCLKSKETRTLHNFLFSTALCRKKLGHEFYKRDLQALGRLVNDYSDEKIYGYYKEEVRKSFDINLEELI